MDIRGETRLSTATGETSLDAGLLELIELSSEVVCLAVLFIFNICDQLRLCRTNAKKCWFSGPYIVANMQMNGGRAEKTLTLSKPQEHLHPKKGTSFTLAYIRHIVL